MIGISNRLEYGCINLCSYMLTFCLFWRLFGARQRIMCTADSRFLRDSACDLTRAQGRGPQRAAGETIAEASDLPSVLSANTR